MTEHDDERPDVGGVGGVGGVGSVGEEAAKLFGALSDWARESGPAATNGVSAGEPVREWGHAFADALKGVDEHVATGGEDCRYCPVCQVIHVVRATSPEVRQHLTVAASSLLQAAAGLLATQVPRPGRTGVEKIDLTDDTTWDDER